MYMNLPHKRQLSTWEAPGLEAKKYGLGPDYDRFVWMDMGNTPYLLSYFVAVRVKYINSGNPAKCTEFS